MTAGLITQAEEYLVSGELIALQEKSEPPALPVHIVHREGCLASTKVRAFIDLTAERPQKGRALNYAGSRA